MKTKKSLTQSFLIILLVVATFPVVILGGIAIQRQYSAFNNESVQLRKKYIESQKVIVKQEVERVLAYIERRRAMARIPEKELQKEVLEWVSLIRFPNHGNEEGILLVRSYQGVLLMSVSTPELIGKDLSKLTDPDGINTHDQFMKIVRNPQGGYAEYSWYNPVTRKVSRKMSFVKGVPEWQWYIGAGFWFDDINAVIEQKRQELKRTVEEYVAVILLTLLILLLPVFLILRYLSRKMEKNFAGFSSFFNEAAKQSAKIDIEQMEFSEFHQLALSANRMIEEREQARAELQKAFQKRKELEHIIDNSPAVVFLWRNDEGWPVEYVSENVRQFGYTADEFISGRIRYAQIVSAEDLQRLTEELKDYSESNISDFSQEYRIVTRDGQVRWINDSTWIRRDERGRITHYQGIIIDITESKRSAETSKLLGDILEKSINEIYLFDVESFNFIHVNQGALQNLGYSIEELRHLTPIDLKPEFTVESFKKLIAPLLSGKIRKIMFTTRHRRKNGSEYPVEVHLQLSEFESRSVFMAVILDITERRRAEESLRTSEEKYRKLFENSPDAVAIITGEGRILDVNRACCEMLGYSRDEIANLNAVETFLDPSGWKMLTAEIISKGVVINSESKRRKKDGTQINCLTSALARLDENGMISEIQCITRDITELQRLEQQFLHAQKMESVGRLAGGVAHDFNNMLSIILGRAELLMMANKEETTIIKGLKEIRGAAERSADLVRQLLTFARRQTVTPKVLDLNETVEGMLKMLRRLIGEDIDLAWMPGRDLYPVKIDPTQVDQILANLCVNARDAIKGVGKITIETRNFVFDQAYCVTHLGSVPGEQALLTVTDNGCGMDKETLSNIFEPFFTTKEPGQGTGLGLATVYGIVKQNNGFINVYSEPAQGTTFSIYLPRHAEKEESTPKAAPETPAALGSETILLVEDEATILELATIMLEKLGYKVLAAAGPDEALRIAKTYPEDIHLLMTDVIMPEMNGQELAKTIRAFNSRIKHLFMSGYTSDVIARHSVLEEGVNFIQKPFSLKDLADKVRMILDNK